MVTAFIFARGGSKGLPGKNIKDFMGKPLIAWSIEQALAVSRIKRVIVSTDSEEIALVAESFGAEVPFIRPSELSTDSAPEWLAWRHALEFLKKKEGHIPSVIISLPTTSPLRSLDDIESCIDMFENQLCDIVVTVKEADRSPYFNMVTVRPDGKVQLAIPSNKKIFNRQDAPKVYDLTTVAYVARSSFIMSHNSIFEGHVRMIKIPKERAVDIDTLLDFKFAEMLYEMNKNEDN